MGIITFFTAALTATPLAPPAGEAPAANGLTESFAASTANVAPAFSWSGYFQALAVMAVLLFVLWGVLWLVRRSGKCRLLPVPNAFPRDALRTEAQLSLGAKKGLVVVRYLDKRLLLGVTEQQISLLHELSLETEASPMPQKKYERDAQLFNSLLQESAASSTQAAQSAHVAPSVQATQTTRAQKQAVQEQTDQDQANQANQAAPSCRAQDDPLSTTLPSMEKPNAYAQR